MPFTSRHASAARAVNSAAYVIVGAPAVPDERQVCPARTPAGSSTRLGR